MKNTHRLLFCFFLFGLLPAFAAGCRHKQKIPATIVRTKGTSIQKADSIFIDTADYNRRMQALHGSDTSGKWDLKTSYPLPGAILPYNRVVAFYGNLYSKRMGILGALPREQMLAKLQEEVTRW